MTSEDRRSFSGTWYITPTTFTGSGDLDRERQGRIIEAAISWGVAGITATGVMAEPGSLTTSERAAAPTRIIEVARLSAAGERLSSCCAERGASCDRLLWLNEGW